MRQRRRGPFPRAPTAAAAGTLVTTGPFAETVEQLGGYFVVDVRDEDEALELARALPSEVVEVREIVTPQESSS